jgi:hypothetical protein
MNELTFLDESRGGSVTTARGSVRRSTFKKFAIALHSSLFAQPLQCRVSNSFLSIYFLELFDLLLGLHIFRTAKYGFFIRKVISCSSIDM